MENLLDNRGLTEAQAIERYQKKNYPKPALTADIVIFRKEYDTYRLLLVRRGNHPFCGKWALPGGFANENEAVEHTASRELTEETGVSGITLKLAGIFSKPGRDPRGWIVSAAYWAVVDFIQPIRAGDDASDARWFTLLPEQDTLTLVSGDIVLTPDDLAFDHSEILAAAIRPANLDLQ